MKDTLPARARFAEFELDLRTGELHGRGQTVRLTEKPFRVLMTLVEHGGELVAREEIQKKLWPNDTIVDFEHSINAAIKNLRRALGDSADQPKYIETFARRGYRLMVPIEWTAADKSPTPTLSPEAGKKGGAPAAAVPAQPDPGALTGRTVSHYRVLDIIGGGGMGVVYRAEDLKLGRAVALKFLPEELGSDPQALERFSREARAASSLDHPNICPIYEFGEHEGRPLMVMQLLEGQTLRDRLAGEERALPLGELLDIGLQVCDGLRAAHEKGIIHRDIKPANIFITDKGICKILDFGIAKLLVEAPGGVVVEAPGFSPANPDNGGMGLQPRPEEVAEPGLKPESRKDADRGAEARRFHQPVTPAEATLTRTGIAMGTAGYMSPEQARGEQLDARTDLFSFGLVLYEMATGQRAFSGGTAAVVHDAILNNSPIPIRDLNSTLPAKLIVTIDTALKKDRERRYQSAAEMRADLEKERRETHPAVPKLLVSGRWKWFAAAALLIAVIVIAGGVYWRSRNAIRFTDKDTIVLADWENQTSDPVFYDALSLAGRIDLYQSPYLNILAPGKINREVTLMGHPGIGWPTTKPVTFDLAKQVCLKTNSTAVLGGSISDRGNGYHLALRAVSCQSGALLASSEADAVDRGAIVKTLGALGLLMRTRLGEPEDSLRKFNAPLEQAASPSLEALQAVEQAYNSQKLADKIALASHAVEIDPNFAFGYWTMGTDLTNAAALDLGNSLAAQSFTRAFNLRDRVDQLTRYRIEDAYYQEVTGELNKTEQVLLQWQQQYPRARIQTTLLGSLTDLHKTMGNWEACVSEAEEGHRDRPDAVAIYASLIWCNSAMGRLDQARSASEEARARGLDSAFLRRQRYDLAFLLNDSAGMQEQVAWAEREKNLNILWMQSDTEAFYGHSRRARKLAGRVMGLALRAGDKEKAALFGAELALREAEVGNTSAALGFAHDALTLHKIPGAEILGAVTLARTGRGEEAQKLADEVSRNHPLDDAIQKNWLPSISAAANLGSDPQVGIRRLALAYPFELGDVSFTTETFGRLYPVYMRGLSYLSAGQGQQAAGEFQKILDHRGVVVNFIIGALAHLQLGRAQAMMGDKDAARRSYQEFLTLWKDADPDIPIYGQAKAEYAKLK